MFARRSVVVAAAMCLTAGLAGCHPPARAVIADLPADSIVDGGRAPRPGREARSRPAPSAVRAASGEAAWVPKSYERPWRWIVIHHSASDVGSAEMFDRWHRARGWDELGYHFVITNGNGGTDGRVEVGSRWEKQKWGAHCKTPGNLHNNYGIGICLVGDFCRKLPSRRQLAGLERLVCFLMRRYRIDPADVIGHRDAPGASTKCPGEALHRHLDGVLRPRWARTCRLARK